MVQWLFINDICLRICRLTDPAEMNKHENLALARIVNKLPPEYTALREDLELQLQVIQAHAKTFRTIRNKKLAHLDHSAYVAGPDEVLPGISRELVEKALASIADFMNRFEREFIDSTTLYRDVITRQVGDSLLLSLHVAEFFEEKQRNGEIPLELQPGPIGSHRPIRR
jgi:hypothetical protein